MDLLLLTFKTLGDTAIFVCWCLRDPRKTLEYTANSLYCYQLYDSKTLSSFTILRSQVFLWISKIIIVIQKKKQVYFCSCQVNASHFHTLNFVSLLILITLLWKALKSPAQNNTEQVKSSCVAEQLHSSINSKTDEVVRSSRKTFLWALKNITEVRWIGHFCAWKKKKTYLKILFFRFSLWEFYYKCLYK